MSFKIPFLIKKPSVSGYAFGVGLTTTKCSHHPAELRRAKTEFFPQLLAFNPLVSSLIQFPEHQFHSPI